MNALYHQTKQAFFFSLAFYLVSVAMMLLKLPFAPIVVSIAMLVSLIWVILVAREILLSPYISSIERVLLLFFVIAFNIFGGLAYFYLLRERVTGIKKVHKQ